MFDVESLTLGEIAKVEALADMPIGAIGDDTMPKGKALAALAFVVGRRTDRPDMTWTQAQDLTMAEATAILGLDEEDEIEDDAAGE